MILNHSWQHSIRFRLVSAILLIFFAQAATAGINIYYLEKQSVQLELLADSARLVVISHELLGGKQQEGSIENRLSRIALYERIVNPIVCLDPANQSATSLDLDKEQPSTESPACKQVLGDRKSTEQIRLSFAAWQRFHKGLLAILNDNKPAEPATEPTLLQDSATASRLSDFIDQQAPELLHSSSHLYHTLKEISQRNTERLTLFNRLSLFLSASLLLVIGYFIYRELLMPLGANAKSFYEIASGRATTNQLLPGKGNELGRISAAFGKQAVRLKAGSILAAAIRRGEEDERLLKIIKEHFAPVLPIDFLGLLRLSPSNSDRLKSSKFQQASSAQRGQAKSTETKASANHSTSCFELVSTSCAISGRRGQRFPVDMGLGAEIRQQKVVLSANLAELSFGQPEDSLIVFLLRENKQSAAFLPLGDKGTPRAVLVLAADYLDAYGEEHEETLEDIANLLSIGLAGGSNCN